MAQEQQEWKALGNIVPMMSLNKHINGVPNYSLHDTINMRMSNDRMSLQNIEEVGDNEVIMNYLNSIYPDVYVNPLVGYIKGYKILYILPCNNELILFVWNKSLSSVINPNGSKCVELIRYNEQTKTINRVYSALTYYGGKYVGEYTYNYDGYLIISFCEYFEDFNNNYNNLIKTITLGNGKQNDYNTLDYDEKLFYNEPEIIIPKVKDIYKVKGKGYFGWHFFYIRYKINKYNYTRWIYIGSPILLEYKNNSTIFKNIVTDTSPSESLTVKNVITADNSNYTDDTIGIKMLFEDNILYNEYQLGVIIINNTSIKKFRTDDILFENDNVDFIYNLSNLIEDEIDIASNYNYYNVKNIVNYKNRLYISNYKENNILEQYNTNNIKLSLLNIGTSYHRLDSYTIANINVLDGALFSQSHLINPLIWNGINERQFDRLTQIVTVYGYDYNASSAGNPVFVTIEADINNIQYFITYHTIRGADNQPVIHLIIKDVNNVNYELLSAQLKDSSPDYIVMHINNTESEPYSILATQMNKLKLYYIFVDISNLRYFNANELLYYATNIDYYNLQEKTFFTTLSPGEVYKFYIHFVDKFGNITNGFPIYNNRKLYYKYGNRTTEYTIFSLGGNEIGGSAGYMLPDLYAIPINYTISDILNLSFVDNSVIIKVSSIENDDNYDLFDGSYVTTSNIRQVLNTAFNKNNHFYDIGDERGFLNESFGLYINSKNERLFYIPYMRNNNNYGLNIENVVIPNGYIGYYISVKKPYTRQKFIGIYNGYYYSDDMNILLEKPSFEFFKSFQVADDLTQLTKDYRVNVKNKLNIQYINAENTKTFRLAGDPTKDRLDRSTALGDASSLGDFLVGVGVDTNKNLYIDKSHDLYIIGGINTINDSNIILSLPGHDYYTTAIIYDETYGFKFDISTQKSNTIPKIFEIITKSNKYLTRRINTNPLVSTNVVYVLPINSINLFESIIKERFELDINYLEEINNDKNYISVFNNSIRFSNVISDESIEEKWRKFDIESYKLISENKGKIVKLFVLGESMFIHCEQSIYLLQFKDYLATTEESLQITQSSIKDISYKELLPTDKGYAGLQDKDATIIGSFGYIFYENDTNRILRLDNNQLIHIDYPILEWLQKYKPYKVRFANDVERNNLLIQFNYIVNNEERLLILLYDYAINTFISVLNPNIFWFTESYNTKNKLYLLQNNTFINHRVAYETSSIKCFNNYKFEKNIFKILNQNNEYIELTNKLGFVYNYNYNGIKFLENIMFKLFKYTKSEDPNTQNSIDFINDPIENIRIPFCGDYVRIYNENIDTGWIDIKNAQTQNFNDRNNYELPYYYLGDWIMNMFRNIRNKQNDINYSKISGKDYTKADDRARLYGNYFIVEFGFNINNFNDDSNKFEIQSLVVNTTQQTNNL